MYNKKNNFAYMAAIRKNKTKDLIKKIEDGTAPWQTPWPEGVKKERPRNHVSGKEYKGCNMVWLDMAEHADPRWMTANQVKAKGWHIKDGEYVKCKIIEFASYYEKKTVLNKDTGEEEEKYVLRKHPVFFYNKVYNGEQIDGIPNAFDKIAAKLPEKEMFDNIEAMVKESGAKVLHDSPGEAYYDVEADVIHLSPREIYKSTYDMYASLLHEMSHWTCHPSRLNRVIDKDDMVATAREELTAEMASYFMAHDYGVGATKEHIDNHASFIAQWVSLLDDNKSEIFSAARTAETIRSYILNIDSRARGIDPSMEDADREVPADEQEAPAQAPAEHPQAKEPEQEQTVKTEPEAAEATPETKHDAAHDAATVPEPEQEDEDIPDIFAAGFNFDI